MQTYKEVQSLEDDPGFTDKREKIVLTLDLRVIDEPIRDIVEGFLKVPYCYTIQCCFGHSVLEGDDEHNLTPLSTRENLPEDTEVLWRIPYIAFCIQNSEDGERLIEDLGGLAVIDPYNIQFCSAEWFLQRWTNTYALQVEPERFKEQDTATVGVEEALALEEVRDRFFSGLRGVLKRHL